MQKLYYAKGKKKATSEDAYLQETMHVSNHTLAWTVSTEIYCTLEMDVHVVVFCKIKARKKKVGSANAVAAALPQQEAVKVGDGAKIISQRRTKIQ